MCNIIETRQPPHASGSREMRNLLLVVQRVRDLFADVLITEEGELSVGRNFLVYIKGMEAGMGLKLQDMFRWILPGLIVDAGCGSGKMLEHLSALYAHSQIVGVDLSTELLRVAESLHYPNHNVSVVRGNIIAPRFKPGSVSTFLYSSVIHEVRSYTNYSVESVRSALRNAFRSLRLHGRIIIRDGVKPPNGNAPVWVKMDEETQTRFRRFAVDFKKNSENPGVPFVEREHEGQKWFIMSMHHANEFLGKKDYLENWDIEVNEEFGTFTLTEWESELEALGFRVLEARSYLNDWIKTNRYDGRVWLHADAGDKPGALLPFPDSTAILVAEKLTLSERID
jgi:SAM-dependent methyltransferase